MLIDAHAHLDRYVDPGPVLEEIVQNGIFTISNSMDVSSYLRNQQIAAACDLVLPAFGVHPWNAAKYADHLADLSSRIESSPILGEIGLDYQVTQDVGQQRLQCQVLEFFLAAAKEQNKVINLHIRGAEREMLNLLDEYGIRWAIIHGYSGSLEVLHELVAREFYFSLGVEVLFSAHVQAIVRALPSGLLLTETDNPGVAKRLIGTLGMPILVQDILRGVAELRTSTDEAINGLVLTNFKRLVDANPVLSESCGKRMG